MCLPVLLYALLHACEHCLIDAARIARKLDKGGAAMEEVPNLLKEGRPFSFELLCEVNSIKNGLSTYVELAHEVERMLDQKAEQLGEQLQSTLRGLAEIEHQDVHETYAQSFRDYESTFRFLQREAMFLTLYNYFEHFLNKLCDWIGEEIRSRVQLKDIQGQGIQRAFLFLDLIPQFEFTKIPLIMGAVRGSNQLRNIIVHAGAVLPEDGNHKVNQFVSGHDHLRGEPGQQVSLQAEFIEDFAKSLHAFFEEFEMQMQSYMDRTWRKALAP